jgi:CheY-like chemotaxis protein
LNNILIVEDELIPAKLLQTLLSKAGYEVIEIVKTGERAIEIVKDTPPDIILMDIRLQGEIDGITAMHEIRKFSDIPVIYVTGNSDSYTKSKAKETNSSGYFIKPYDYKELLQAIKDILDY